MDESDHKALIILEQQGKILIGIDRTFARRFYMNVPNSIVHENTGEIPYFEKLVVGFAFYVSPIALLISLVFALLAFSYWGLIALLCCPIIYLIYYSKSSSGGASNIFITTLFLTSVGLLLFGSFQHWAVLFTTSFLFSLWSARFLYSASSVLLRCFIIRNHKAFSWIHSKGECVIKYL